MNDNNNDTPIDMPDVDTLDDYCCTCGDILTTDRHTCPVCNFPTCESNPHAPEFNCFDVDLNACDVCADNIRESGVLDLVLPDIEHAPGFHYRYVCVTQSAHAYGGEFYTADTLIGAIHGCAARSADIGAIVAVQASADRPFGIGYDTNLPCVTISEIDGAITGHRCDLNKIIDMHMPTGGSE